MSKTLLLALLATAVLLLLSGCSKPRTAHSATRTARDVTDLPAEPPDGWDALLAWTDAQLTWSVPPQPRPRPYVAPAPRVPVVRLVERFHDAHTAAEWQPPPAQDATLVHLGPFRSDQPTRSFRVQISTAGRRPATALDFRSFHVQCEDVGAIEIELHQPFGSYFELEWATAGKIRIPLPGNERFWTLRIQTDSLAEWRGPLDSIRLYTDGLATAPIEIRALRLLRRSIAFPEPVGVRRGTLARQIRDTLYAHPPADIRFDNVTLPDDPRLHVGLGAWSPDDASSSSVEFRIEVESVAERATLLAESVDPGAGWLDRTIPLDAWAGQTVSLWLRATSDDPDQVACWGSPTIYAALPDPPCIIVYLIDAHAAVHSDLYGYRRDTTPRLRALADQGVWFSNVFANSPRTLESIPDLMLSLPTAQHGVRHPSAAPDPDLVTLAEVLSQAGFATASFCTNVNAGPRQGMDQGFDSFFDHITFWWDGPADRTVPIDDVLAWTAAHADRPRFVYIHTAEPHAPYTPPAAYAQAYRTAYRGPIDGSFDPEHGFEHATSSEALAHVVALYDAEVAYADARLGEFVDALQAARMWDTTNLFVIADHGQEFLEHGHWEHGKNLYREALRIPMVAVGPDITHRGRVDTPVQLFDLMPTILDLAGLHPPYRLAGASLLPLLHDPDEPPQTLLGDAARPYTPGVDFANRVIVSSNHWFYASAGDDVVEYSAIAGGRWKLLFRRDVPVPEGVLRGVVRADGPVQRFALYDLEQDALELHDLLGTDGYHDVARELMLALVAWRQQHAPFDGGGGGALELGGDQLRELRSLGYISNE